MNSITIKITANTLNDAPKTIVQGLPNNAETIEVANVITAKNINSKIANTNIIMGTIRGMQ